MNEALPHQHNELKKVLLCWSKKLKRWVLFGWLIGDEFFPSVVMELPSHIDGLRTRESLAEFAEERARQSNLQARYGVWMDMGIERGDLWVKFGVWDDDGNNPNIEPTEDNNQADR